MSGEADYVMPAGQKIGPGAKFVYKIVKNESARKDPPEIYGWRAFALACSACFGGMLFGFDIGTIGGVLILPAFERFVAPVFLLNDMTLT